MNSSLIDSAPQVDETIDVVALPADDIAGELDNPKSTNMVALGAYLGRRGYLSPDAAAQALADVLAERYHQTLPANSAALHKGAEFATRPS